MKRGISLLLICTMLIFGVEAVPVLETLEDGSLVCNGGSVYSWNVNNKPFYALYLPLNQDTNDYSGNNNNLIDENNIWLSDCELDNGCLSYDNIQDVAYINDDNSLDFNNEFSAEAWVYLNDKSYSENERIIVSKMTGTVGEGQYTFGVSDEDTLMARLWNESGDFNAYYSGVDIPLQQWVHVAVVFKNNKLYFYKNGAFGQELETTVTNIYNSEYENDGVYVGNWWNLADFNFLGRIDNLILYDRAVTDSLLLKHANKEYNIIPFDMINKGDEWICSAPEESNLIITGNSLPTGNVNLNLIGNDLICEVTNINDPDGDQVQVIYNWIMNDNGIMVLNTPLEDLSAVDYSGYNNNGLVYNSERVEDKNGNEAINFSTESYIEIEDDNSLDLKNNFTIEAWVKLAEKDIFYERIIVSKWDTTSTTGQYTVGIAEADTLMVRLMDENKVYSAYYSGVSIPINEWTYVVVTLNNGNLDFYRNGELIQTIPTNVTNLYNEEYEHDNLFIGNWWNFVGGFNFVGSLDDVKIYNKVLTLADIRNHYLNNYNRLNNENNSLWK